MSKDFHVCATCYENVCFEDGEYLTCICGRCGVRASDPKGIVCSPVDSPVFTHEQIIEIAEAIKEQP